MSSSNNEGTVTVPVSSDNPLLHRLSPSQFQASVKFYEADHNLTLDDRREIANDLQVMVPKIGIASNISAISGFFGLTIYDRLKNRNPTQLLKVEPNPLMARRFVKQPFVSFCIGLICMVIGGEVTARYQFNSKMDQLQSIPDKQRQLEVWKTLDHHQASLFFMYYKKSSEDPSYILKDPRTFTERELHEVHYSKPMPKSKNGVFGREDDRMVIDPDSKNLTHWEQIRRANGFAPPAPSPTSGNQGTSTDILDSGVGSNETPTDDTPSPKSAWERVREAKK